MNISAVKLKIESYQYLCPLTKKIPGKITYIQLARRNVLGVIAKELESALPKNSQYIMIHGEMENRIIEGTEFVGPMDQNIMPDKFDYLIGQDFCFDDTGSFKLNRDKIDGK